MTAALEHCLDPTGDIFAFAGIPTQASARQDLTGAVDDVVRNLAEILTRLISEVIDNKTETEFQSAFDEAFPNYARLTLALSGVIRSTVPQNVIDRIAAQSFSELEAELRDYALAEFGSDVQSQAIFTVWTLRKINDINNQLVALDEPSAQVANQDRECLQHFAMNVLRARFSLDCLAVSIHSKRRYPLYPEVLECVTDGLRSAVNAYAWIRQGLDLRLKTEEPVLDPREWDEEDRELVGASCDLAGNLY